MVLQMKDNVNFHSIVNEIIIKKKTLAIKYLIIKHNLQFFIYFLIKQLIFIFLLNSQIDFAKFSSSAKYNSL